MKSTARYVSRQDGDMWLGYFERYPDYLAQGESLSEPEENLRDGTRICGAGKFPAGAAYRNLSWNNAD